MTTFSTGAGLKSAPYNVPRGAIVTVTPGPGASATVESTSSSAADVANNVATWAAWPNGLVSGAPSSLLAGDNMFLRIIAVGGKVDCEIDESPTARALAPFRPDWAAGSSNSSLQPFYGTAIANLGDSIGAAEGGINSGGLVLQQRGVVNNMLSSLGHPWDFQPSDIFAVGGKTTLDIINEQLPLLRAANATRRYSRVFISSVTNDTNSGLFTAAQIKANLMTVFQEVRAMGAIPVHFGVLPRGSASEVTTPKQMNADINSWLFQQSLTGLIEFPNLTEVLADNTTAFGNAIMSYMYDGAIGQATLHPNGAGALLLGDAAADWYRARGVSPALQFATMQSDVFDRVNNPGGVAFNNANPLLQGGTTAPTGMTTSGGTWSTVARNLPNGQARTDRQCALASAATSYTLYDDWVASGAGGAWAITQLQPGDIIEVRAKVVVSNDAAGINNLSLRLAENDGSGGVAHFGMSNQDVGITLPLAGKTRYLKTPRVTVRPYAGSGTAQMFARLEFGNLAGQGAGTVTVQAFEARKVG